MRRVVIALVVCSVAGCQRRLPDAQTLQARNDAQTLRARDKAQTLRARNDTQTVQARNDAQTLRARNDAQSLQARSDAQTLQVRNDTQQQQARDDVQTLQARNDTRPLQAHDKAPALRARDDAQAAREAEQYDRYRQPARIIAGLQLAPGMRVADVGAGHGYLTGRLAKAVGARGHVVATDIDGAALAAIAPSPTVETRVVRAGDPGLEPRSFDRILLAEVDHYLPDRAAYLRQLARALKPGGYIIVTNRQSFRAPLLAAAGAAGLTATELPLALPAHFYFRLEPTS